MFRILAVAIALTIGAPAMGKPVEVPAKPSALRNVLTPDRTRPADDEEAGEGPMSQKDMFLLMWRQSAGDKKLPDRLRNKYGITPEEIP